MKQIPLTRGYFALVDDEDYAIVNQYKWTYDNGYAIRKARLAPKKYKHVSLHRFLTNAQPGQVVDHADGNRQNNTRSNLRVCNGAQNSVNRRTSKIYTAATSSKYRGVCKEKHGAAWRFRAAIHHNGRRIRIGNFKTEIEAAKAYDAKARELYGEFAVPNFPDR